MTQHFCCRRWQHVHTKSGPFLISEWNDTIACCTDTSLAFLAALVVSLCFLSCSFLCKVCSLVWLAPKLASLLLSASRLCKVCSLFSLALKLAFLHLSVSCLCKVCSLVSLALLVPFCNPSQLIWHYLTVTLACVSWLCLANYGLKQMLARFTHFQPCMYNRFSHCGHTLLGGMI